MAPFRYRKLGYAALNVTDLDRSVRFYRDIVGLRLEERIGDEVAFLRCSDDHHNLVLYRNKVVGLRRVGFQLESDGDLERAHEYVAMQGWSPRAMSDAECDALAQGPTFRFRIPGFDMQFEFYAQIARVASPYEATVAKIARFGHVVVAAKNSEEVGDVLTSKLNFSVSDNLGDQVVFLRCFPNPFHHSFGITKSKDLDRLQHLNLMVTDVNDIGRAMNRMRDNNVPIVYGPGRHDISDSIFLYFLDPDALTIEYSFGMEEFAELTARPPRNLPMLPEILDCWGGRPAPDFGKCGLVDPTST